MNKLNTFLIIALTITLLIFGSYIYSDVQDMSRFIQPYIPRDQSAILRIELAKSNFQLDIIMMNVQALVAMLNEADKEVYKIGAFKYQIEELMNQKFDEYNKQEEEFISFMNNLVKIRRQLLSLVWQLDEWEDEPYFRGDRLSEIKNYLISVFNYNEEELSGWIKL